VRFSTVWLGALALLASPAWARPRTDLVVLNNGERVTCEMKKLQRGKLIVKTDAFGTKARIELVRKLYWSVTVYESFDSEPPSTTSRRRDFGITTSVGWSFNGLRKAWEARVPPR
jgi:hypothetical protein